MRSIGFGGPMIRRLDADAKTQTRRILNMKRLRVRLPSPVNADWPMKGGLPAGVYSARIAEAGAVFAIGKDGYQIGVKPGEFHFLSPYVDGSSTTVLMNDGARKTWTIIPDKPARLWVREAVYLLQDEESKERGRDVACYEADHAVCPYLDTWPWKKRKALTMLGMPFGMHRFQISVHMIRVQRLQEITEEDAIAEGIIRTKCNPEGDCWTDGVARTAFEYAWNEIHGWNPNAWGLNPWVSALSFQLHRREEEASS